MTTTAEARRMAPEDRFTCPECGLEVATQRGLSQHRAKVHGILSPTSSRQRDAAPAPSPAGGEAQLRALQDRLIGHFAAISTLLAGLGLYHSALTLVSRSVDRTVEVTGPDGEPVLMDGRPVQVERRGIARVLIDHGRKDVRILRGILAFDRFMSAGDELQLGLELAASVAADLVPDPRSGLQIPGTRIVLAPAAIIPDVVDQVEKIRVIEAQEAAAQAPPAPDGARPRSPKPKAAPGVEVIEGGVTST